MLRVMYMAGEERGDREPDPASRFDDLFQRLYPGLFGLTFRLLGDDPETEDTLQEAFSKLTDSPLLTRSDDEVAAWMRRVCLELGARRLRTGRRTEQQSDVRQALGALPERQRDCLLLRYSGYSYAEIAATLEVAVGSVGLLLVRAEREFRHTLCLTRGPEECSLHGST